MIYGACEGSVEKRKVRLTRMSRSWSRSVRLFVVGCSISIWLYCIYSSIVLHVNSYLSRM